MSLFDTTQMMAMISSMSATTQAAQQSFTQGFTAGGGSMSMSGPDMMSNIVNSVSKMNDDVSSQLKQVMTSLQAEVDAHHGMQTGEMPEGYETKTDDLRTAESRGFPQEDANFFSTLPRYK